MSRIVYLCHPLDDVVPGVRVAAATAVEYVLDSAAWAGWSIRTIEYDMAASVKVNDVSAGIIARLGPLVLLEPVQGKTIDLFRRKLHGRASVLVRTAHDPDGIVNCLEEARRIHESGEPQVPRAFVIALLLLRKLEQLHMWGGKQKGYLWFDDLAKGRGLDEKFEDGVTSVVGFLLQDGLLIQKKSQNSRKYALNPDRREEIHETLRARAFRSPRLQEALIRDRRETSARELDLLDSYVQETPHAHQRCHGGKP